MNFALLFVLFSCVLSETNAIFRVIGSEIIDIKRSPHSVAIFKSNRYICVGSLVSTTSVVTAAHCVENTLSIHLTVLAGVTHIYNEKGQRSFVKEINIHPQYNSEEISIDIAVVKVTPDFKENGAVKAIELCEEVLKPGLSMQVSGWGCRDVNHKIASPVLITKHVEIAECRSVNANKNPEDGELPFTIIFAGHSLEDLYDGDSGAGAVRNGRLCAVAQFVFHSKNIPPLFIDVLSPTVLNFIKSKM